MEENAAREGLLMLPWGFRSLKHQHSAKRTRGPVEDEAGNLMSFHREKVEVEDTLQEARLDAFPSKHYIIRCYHKTSVIEEGHPILMFETWAVGSGAASSRRWLCTFARLRGLGAYGLDVLKSPTNGICDTLARPKLSSGS